MSYFRFSRIYPISISMRCDLDYLLIKPAGERLNVKMFSVTRGVKTISINVFCCDIIE